MQDARLAAHLANRIAFGPSPGDIEHIRELGLEGYLDEQLDPDALPLPPQLVDQLRTYPTLDQDSMTLLVEYGPIFKRAETGKLSKQDIETIRKSARQIVVEAAEARLAHAVMSPRQLNETMVEFWANHFNIFAGKGLDLYWPGTYEREAIRPHALGNFRDLLLATAKHPAMLFYLDNWQNTAPDSLGARGRFKGLNENYAREVMELHTLGVDGGYTQADVIALARILTGWSFLPRGGRALMVKLGMERASELPNFSFDESRHDDGTKVLLGRSFEADGLAEGEAALTMLARHPATARHISWKLAQYYVEDRPDPALVAAMAKTFERTDGAIPSVLRTLFTSARFRDPTVRGAKFKTPHRYVVSAVRASGRSPRNMLALLGTLRQLGQTPFGCQTPDGYKCTEDAWLNPDAMTRRIAFGIALGAGRLPLDSPPPPLDDRAAIMREFKTAATNKAAEALDPERLIATLGVAPGAATRSAIDDAPPKMKAGIVLGSPEFMMC
jgi:uncharacterized protein (DUF1800 family)